jgi:hypothetical protein
MLGATRVRLEGPYYVLPRAPFRGAVFRIRQITQGPELVDIRIPYPRLLVVSEGPGDEQAEQAAFYRPTGRGVDYGRKRFGVSARFAALALELCECGPVSPGPRCVPH